MKLGLLSVVAVAAFTIGCGAGNPVTSSTTDTAVLGGGKTSSLAQVLAQRPPAGMVSVVAVRGGLAGGVVAHKNITRAEAQAMNAHRAARQAAVARGETPVPYVTSHGNEIGACWNDDTLWLNDDRGQEFSTRICVWPGDTYEVIECWDQPDHFVFQVKSYWSGNFGFRLWSQAWDTGCFARDSRTLRSGGPWERNDSFGPPYPNYATVNN